MNEINFNIDAILGAEKDPNMITNNSLEMFSDTEFNFLQNYNITGIEFPNNINDTQNDHQVICEFEILNNAVEYSLNPESADDYIENFLNIENFDLGEYLFDTESDCIEDKIVVAMPMKAVHGIYHLSRNRSTPISIYYQGSSLDRFLKIDLLSGTAAREESIKNCTQWTHSLSWFYCNDNSINIGDHLKIPLDMQRIERCLSFKFPCNSSCNSMFNQTILKFSIVDMNNIELCQQSFNIRVSERPGRDERELKDKSQNEEQKHFKYPEDLPQFVNHSTIIKMEVPKLKNFTAPNSKFDISLAADNRNYSGIKFCDSVEKHITFSISEAVIPNPISKLFVRAMIVDPKYPEKPIKCVNNHGNIGDRRNHILRCKEDDSEYQGNENGFYVDDRYSVSTQLKSEISFYFMCKSICFLDRDRPCAGLIIILENELGEMFARRYFKFAIVERPNRTKLNYDSEAEVRPKRKSSNDNKNTKKIKIY